MKKTVLIIVSFILALLTAGILPSQVFADSVPEYISEVKIGMGKEAADAEAALAGYKILSDEKGNKVDLNQNAGGGFASKGEKVVYLGYKTTSDRGDAITDLALMNMKGGYSVQEYEALMKTQMTSRIIPFIDSFLCTVREYRENYISDNEANRQRAVYIHDMLNKLTDDDCAGKGLGDILLNETKYEMGDEAYNKLSAEEKKNHSDILTVLAQSNGNASLLMENLITRAADTGDDTWVDRFTEMDYDSLVDAVDLPPTDAEMELAKLYDDDARKILGMWDAFRDQLINAESKDDELDIIDSSEYREDLEKIKNFDITTATDKEIEELGDIIAKAEVEVGAFTSNLTDVIARAYLETIDYGEGTLLDFFTQPYEEVAQDIKMLYPIAASLSEGQKAGLEFVSLSDLVIVAGAEPGNYADSKLDEMEPVSIYDGVDRGIYKKGGVALTSDTLRTKADALSPKSGNFPLVGLIFTLLSAGLAVTSLVALVKTFKKISVIKNEISLLEASIISGKQQLAGLNTAINDVMRHGASALSGGQITYMEYRQMMYKLMNERDKMEPVYYRMNNTARENIERLSARSSFCQKLAVGLSIAMVVLTAVTVYLSYMDMVSYYDVEFTPVPHYMVDEKDITAYNEQGEKIIIKNQTAYYSAVDCNRTDKDEMYANLGTCADMNGDVGKQWLALYAQKSEYFAPILASSLLAKVSDTDVPAGYTTGIHMLGSGSAFNLNSELYDWNQSAPSIMVYFKTDISAAKPASAAGSTFSAGALAVSGSVGLAVGAIISALAVMEIGKKKKAKAA